MCGDPLTTRFDQQKEGSSQVDLGYHFVATDARDGLVGYWRLDEGSGNRARDSSGYDHEGTLFGGPSWASGQIGAGALSFDGTDDYVSASESSALRLGDLTVAFWMKKNAEATEWSRLVGKGNSSLRT